MTVFHDFSAIIERVKEWKRQASLSDYCHEEFIARAGTPDVIELGKNAPAEADAPPTP